MRAVAMILIVLSTVPQAVFAHGPDGPAVPRDWEELWTAWAWDPLTALPLAGSAVLYGWGLRRLWRRAGAGHGVRRWEAWCFAGGWLALAVALVSPLHPWGEALFSAHMAQHEVLMLVAAPLLVFGKPVVACLHAVSAGWARRLSGWTRAAWWRRGWWALTGPAVAGLIHAAVLWAWHAPSLFQAVLSSDLVHAAQHLSFLLSALLFWYALLEGRKAADYGTGVLCLFVTALHSGLLGALLTLAPSVWYPAYEETTATWGLTPLEDQHLGGLIMWVPACTVYVLGGLGFFAAWLRDSERRTRAWQAGLTYRKVSVR